MRKILLIVCCGMGGVLAEPAQRPASQLQPGYAGANPYSSPADTEAGRRLYVGRCGNCHGQNGEGGRGAALNTGRLRHGSTDREIFLVIRNGVPNTEMPGSPNSAEVEVWRMVAYVRQLGRQGLPEPVTGDAPAGAIVYREKDCALCHRIGGTGGLWGPDLSDIGAQRAVWFLRESVVAPSAHISLEYRTVEVITLTGENSRGIHLNEDEYSIHLRDSDGNLRSFMKQELKDIKLPRESPMPAYALLPKGDLENLVAYLSSLQLQK